jgi:hypothetical protein
MVFLSSDAIIDVVQAATEFVVDTAVAVVKTVVAVAENAYQLA